MNNCSLYASEKYLQMSSNSFKNGIYQSSLWSPILTDHYQLMDKNIKVISTQTNAKMYSCKPVIKIIAEKAVQGKKPELD